MSILCADKCITVIITYNSMSGIFDNNIYNIFVSIPHK